MTYFLYGLFFVSCIVLVISVLLQPGKTDAGALFTSSVSSNAYGARGTATVLSKTTIITATIFMISALMLSMPALTGNVSVLSSNPDSPATEAPANTNANVDPNAPANANVNAVSPVQQPPITNLNSATPANANAASNAASNKAANAAKPEAKKDTNAKK